MARSGLVPRRLEQAVLEQLDRFPAVALLGPRQVGKTTLARQIAQQRKALVLDLESPADRAKLQEPELFLSRHHNQLLILFVLETLLTAIPQRCQAFFYRTAGVAEMDLVIDHPDGERWAIKVKRSLTPTLSRGFHQARADLHPQRCFVVIPREGPFPLAPGVDAVGLAELAAQLAG
jgi:hypothetical protein